MKDKQDIIIVSTNDWNGFWFQRQEFATRFAAMGHRVFFINRIPQRTPMPGRLIRWIFSNRQSRKIINPVPEGVMVLSPFILPPYKRLRFINRYLWKRLWKQVPEKDRPVSPVLITYQPTYNVQDLSDCVGASRLVYINTHVYDEDPSCPKDLLVSEAQVVSKADVLMADSFYNVKRLTKYVPGAKVHRAMPGVDVERFFSAYRGDEVEKSETLLFFGDIGSYLDLEIYNFLAEKYKVVFVGIVNPSVSGDISNRIEVMPPVPSPELPEVLRRADVLTIFYKDSDYVKGILPAKFFECLATGKPLFVSGLPETKIYSNVIYYIENGADEVESLMSNLAELESLPRKEARRKVALEADWGNRYNRFYERVFGL